MIFSPVQLAGRVLVDGGIINPLPIAPTLNDGSELTIAGALNGLPEVFDVENEENLKNNDNNESKSKHQIGIEKFIAERYSK